MKRLIFAILLGVTTSAAAQAPGPSPMPGDSPGTVGVIGLDGAVDKFYGATHKAIIKTADGVRHLVHLTGKTVVHGADEAAGATFDGLEEGSRVVVHGVVEGGQTTAVEIDRIGKDALHETEGTVERIDRKGRTLTIRLADGSTTTLRLTERAARDVAKDVVGADRVVVYYANASGTQVAHFFKKVRRDSSS
jgi:hypothetical protein